MGTDHGQPMRISGETWYNISTGEGWNSEWNSDMFIYQLFRNVAK